MASMVQAFVSVAAANQWLTANAANYTPVSVCYGHIDNSVVILVSPVTAEPPAADKPARFKPAPHG